MTGPDDPARAASLLATAQALEVDRVTGEVVGAMRERGVKALLLKGPALSSWLYDDGETRSYVDCDLLVPLRDQDTACTVLRELGFERDESSDHLEPRFGPLHADGWGRASDGGNVDLHRALSGMRMGGSDVWEELAAGADTIRVGQEEVSVPRPAARALIVAMHAAHHGDQAAQPLEDLRRAVARLPLDTWREAVDTADRLHAIPPLAVGLRMLPEGAEIAQRLGLPSAQLIEAALGRGPVGSTALGFERLAARPGLRAKAALVLAEMFPSPRFLRWWTPLARRGALGLLLSYPWRLLWLAWQAGPGLVAWRRNRARGAS
jgi:hypothetical protein